MMPLKQEVLKALLVYLNEDPEDLIKEYMVSILVFGFYCNFFSETDNVMYYITQGLFVQKLLMELDGNKLSTKA